MAVHVKSPSLEAVQDMAMGSPRKHIEEGRGRCGSAPNEEVDTEGECRPLVRDRRHFVTAPARLAPMHAVSVKNTFLEMQEVDEDEEQPRQFRSHTTSELPRKNDWDKSTAPMYVTDGAAWVRTAACTSWEPAALDEGGEAAAWQEAVCPVVRSEGSRDSTTVGSLPDKFEIGNDLRSESGLQECDSTTHACANGGPQPQHGPDQKSKLRERRRHRRPAEAACQLVHHSSASPETWQAQATAPAVRGCKDVEGFMASQLMQSSLMAAAMAAAPMVWASAAAASGAAVQLGPVAGLHGGLVPRATLPVPQWCFQPAAGMVRAAASADGRQMRTTLMLRNLPNNYTRSMLVDLLDSEGFARRYDFVYVPHDFKTNAGLGFAFVNLVTPYDAECMKQQLEGFRRWCLPSSKTCTVGWSSEDQQGLSANIQRYRNSSVMHHSVSQECKPLLLKDGVPLEFPKSTRKIWPPSDDHGPRSRKQ